MAASAITPDEGQKICADLIFVQSNADRGTSLELGLFTNTTGLSTASVLADLVEPTGGSYARKTLADASWSVDADGTASYAKQTFQAVSTAFSPDITGFFIATTGTAPKLLHLQIEDDVAGTYTATAVGANESYSVTPILDVANA